jgi:hypothetical protein
MYGGDETDKSANDIPEESAFRLYYDRFVETIKKHDNSK